MGASDAELEVIDRWWRAANFLSVAQIYLRGDPLAGELTASSIKPRLLGHWGTCPGLNLVYAHLNRVIRQRRLETIFLAGPGHGGPAMTANTWLEGSFTEAYPDVAHDRDGMAELVRRFSAPYGMPSHAGAEVPGSLHEGGELGYVLAHAYGAVLDDPELVAVAVVGDGEAETGPLAASWHSHRFLAPDRDGAVLPVLHLNGYKIANPTILARMPAEQLDAMLRGFGHDPLVIEGDDPAVVHRRFADVLDLALDRIAEIQAAARDGAPTPGPWPMIVLRTPKGWTGPRLVDGEAIEGHFRSHQVPLEDVGEDPEQLALLQEWLASYRPDELFDERGGPADDLRALAPAGERRMGANPRANGGLRRRDLVLPPLEEHAAAVDERGVTTAKATEVLGGWLADVIRADAATDQFRLFGPDEVASNRLSEVFEVTDRVWGEALRPDDVHLGRHGRVMEVLSEHLCQGWLEGYLLTGRHGLYTSYEAFIHIVDSMVNQHAKWLKVIDEVEWRRPLSSLNYLLTSHVWRQDHNGFSHQDPGFLDHVANKKAEVVRIYLPPDANSLLAVMDRCLASQGRINVVVAGKQPGLQYLPLADARAHCAMGAGIWAWASTDAEAEPDAVLACAGDVPTMEALAAADLLRRHLPELRVRFVNVVDLMALESPERHPHGLSDRTFDSMFTRDRPVIFAHHGYPSLVHELTYKRANHDGLHVHGYSEEGSTTTPFDMTVRNRIDRFHLALDVLDRVPGLGSRAARLRQHLERRLLEHHDHVRRHGEDLPEVRDWAWGRPT